MNKIPKDDAFEVSDSTDWLETPLRSLGALDSALRCQVCKDFYQTPMITSCSHTFCSLCIRRCLSNDGKCPACRTLDQELKLRNNAAVEGLVEAFKNARPEVLEYARKPAAVSGRSSPKRSREQAQMGDEDESPKKRTRSSRRTAGRSSQSTSAMLIADTDEEDEDYVPEQGFVLCPVCQKEVKESTINTHLDRGCMDEPRITKRLSGGTSRKGSVQDPFPIPETATKRPDRLAQINFSMMKEAGLRKKLADMGINAGGSKPLMERRYTEWITLWNANCDATKPRTKGELKKDLETWERTQGGRAQSSYYGQSSGAQIKDKDFDGKAYSTANKDSFRDLIANARKKVPAKSATPEASGSGGQTPPVPDSAITPKPVLEMALDEGGMQRQISPVKSNEPQRKFFEESSNPATQSSQKSSSQHASNISMLDKDSGIPSDLPAIRPVQP